MFLKIFIAVLMPFFAIAQTGNDQSTVEFKFMAKPDSIIKRTNEGYIYISSDTNSKPYEWIVPKLDSKGIERIYSEDIRLLRNKYSRKKETYNLGKIPRAWNSVYKYKGKYVLYGPSDWMFNSGFYISDSVIYVTSSDPGNIYLITGFRSMKQSRYEINAINNSGENKTMIIELVNDQLGIYSWTISGKEKTKSKFILQNSDYSKKLPMIVCDCGQNKCVMNFEFDNETQKYAGVYSFGSNVEKEAVGSLTVYPESDSTILFYLDICKGAPSYNLGQLFERAIVHGDTALYYKKEEWDKNGCKLQMHFTTDTLTIKTIEKFDECPFGGNVYANHKYLRKSNLVPEYFINGERDTIEFRDMTPEKYLHRFDTK